MKDGLNASKVIFTKTIIMNTPTGHTEKGNLQKHIARQHKEVRV